MHSTSNEKIIEKEISTEGKMLLVSKSCHHILLWSVTLTPQKVMGKFNSLDCEKILKGKRSFLKEDMKEL